MASSKAKKRCNQAMPCERCARLGKTCGGYRDLGELLFRDQTALLSARTGSPSRQASRSPRQLSPSKVDMAMAFFFEQVVSDPQHSFLRDLTIDGFLQKPIAACALAAIANRSKDAAGRKLARSYYVEALAATNIALRDARRVKADNTLVSVLLLGWFERIFWEGSSSKLSWQHHISGASQVLRLRGPNQARTKTGAALYREVGARLIVHALQTETEAPEFITTWTRSLGYDPIGTPVDRLIILGARLASLKTSFKAADQSDEVLAEIAARLEQDLLAWSDDASGPDSACSFRSFRDDDPHRTWNGWRHEYARLLAYAYWNFWRTMRMLLSWTQEALWRRSWPTLVRTMGGLVDPKYYRQIRNHMAADICIGAAYAFGNDSSASPPKSSVSTACYLTLPLTYAGWSALETLSEDVLSPGGSRMIFVGESVQLDASREEYTQLAFILDKLDYTSEKVGMHLNGAMRDLLRGKWPGHFHFGRAVIEEANRDTQSQSPTAFVYTDANTSTS